MPELPDIEAYLAALRPRVVGEPLEALRLANPFLLRSVDPAPEALIGLEVRDVFRIGKRIVLAFDGDVFAVLHLMIAGRLRWREPGAKVPGRIGLAAFDFPSGSLIVTEAGTKKRASLHLVAGTAALQEHDPGGADLSALSPDAFAERLRGVRHTIKRALTDPRLFDGIGNAYSDEILHAAGLSPFKRTTQLDDDEIARLHAAASEVLARWTAMLVAEAEDAWPEKVTAFRPDMAVHGKYGEPCPACGNPVQRIRFADNELNYCPECQTDGRLLADRSLSRLLKSDWPRTLAELEALKRDQRD